MAQTKILLVDDHPVFREGLSALISYESDLVVCAQASGIREAMTLAEQESPTLAIVDISLADGSGIDLIRHLLARYPKLLLLVASVYDEQMYAERVIQLGAKGYVCKRDAAQVIITALREILAGHIYLSGHISQRLLDRFNRQPKDKLEVDIDRLTTRELEVMRLMANVMNSREIGEQLNLSAKTIDSYRDRIKQKMGFSNNAELVRFAIEWVRDQGA